MYDTATPYLASFVIIRNKEGKIAFVLRSNTGWMNGFYGLPSGKVEKVESFSEAAIREGKEEIGITFKPENARFVHVMHRSTHDEGNNTNDWVDVFFEVADFEGEPHNAEPDVHGELAWLDPKNLPENVVPSVRRAIEHIEQGDLYSEFGWPNSEDRTH